MLGAQDVRERDLDVARMRRVTERHLLPGEVRELLRRVWMSVGELEQPRERVVVDAAVARLEPRAHEGPELVASIRPSSICFALRQNGSWRSLKIAREHVAAAAEVDVADLALGLEDGPHHVRQRVVDPDDLLELVEHEHDASVALRGDLCRAARAAARSSRRCPSLPRTASNENRTPPSLGSSSTVGLHPQAADDRPRPLEQPLDGREEVVDDRLRERGGEPHLRRRPHQVAVRDEDVVGEDLLHRAEDERRLPVASRREHDDVLPVAHVGGERGDLRPAGS